MSYGANDPNGLPLGLPSILSLGLPPLVNPYPALNLDFIDNQTLDSRVTFSRGSQATLFDSTGTLRYAANNLLNYSQEFNNGYWVKSGVTAATNSTTAPDGTLTADSLLETATTARHGFIGSNGTISLSATRYAYSCYIKANGRTAASLTLSRNSTNVYAVATFDLAGVAVTQTGAVGAGFAYVSSSITAVGDGWYRCVLVCDVPAATNFFAGIYASDATTFTPDSVGGVNNYAGDSSKGLFVWGAQLEIGSTANAYNVTGASAYYAPRFDYNPSTLQPLGLLIEEARTNSLTYSEDFTNAAWVGTNVTISANSASSPAGTTTADTLIATTTNGEHTLDHSFSVASGSTYTFTAFVKAAGLTDIGLRFTIGALWTGGASPQVRFDLTAVSATSFTGSPASFSITNVGNGYYRVQMSVVAAGTGTASARLQLMSGANNSFAGNGTNGVYVWGAQLEAGAFATSYIPTTTTALTRNADVASMTGTNFSSWFNASQGTVVFFGTRSSAGQPNMWMFSNGATATERYYLRYVSGQFQFIPRAGGVDGPGVFVSAAGSLTTARHATAYTSNQDRIASNGTQDGNSTQTITSQPTNLDTLYIGSFTGTGAFLNGTVQKIAFYPTALSNAQLQALTA